MALILGHIQAKYFGDNISDGDTTSLYFSGEKIDQSLQHDIVHDCVENVQKFLEPVFKDDDSLGYQQAKGYTNFAVNFLHHSVLKLKSLTDTETILELLSAAVQCCECCLQTWEIPSTKDTFVVPKLVYHILNVLRHEDYAEQIINLSELVYEILLHSPQPLSPDGQTITTALFACVWNTTNKLCPEKENKISLEITLRLRHCCLMIISLQSDLDKLLDLAKRTTSQFTQFAYLSDSVCCEIQNKMFEHLISRLSQSLKLNGIERPVKLRMCILQLKSLFVEHLLKISNCDSVSEAIQSIQEMGNSGSTSDHTTFLCKCIAQVYTMALCVHCHTENGKQSTGNADLTIDRDIMNFQKCEKYSMEELQPLYNSCNFLLQILGNKDVVISNLPADVVSSLISCLDLFICIANKLLTDIPEKKTEPKKSNKKVDADLIPVKLDETSKTHLALLNGYYRKLLLIWQLLQGVERSDPSHDSLLESARSAVMEYQVCLDNTELPSSEKSKYSYRYNFGYLSCRLGKYCIRLNLYDNAAAFYTISIHHLTICQQPILMKLFECLVECHKVQGHWNEAVKVVVQALLTVKDDVTSVAAMWAQLKREALTNDQTQFMTITLLSMVKAAMKAKPDPALADKDILFAEYSTWTKFSRRNYSVEFHILKELLAMKLTTEEKAAAMIDMATNICITDLVYNDSCPGDLLTKVIMLLDKSPPTQSAQALQALAYYTKYIVVHEDVMQERQRSTDTSPSDKPSEKGDNSEVDDSQNSTYTLQSETTYIPFLYKALELWEKSLGETCSEANIDIGRHVEALVSCSTRLLAMRKPVQALKALQLAQVRMKTISDPKLAKRIQEIQTKLLLFVGRYEEADSIVTGAGDCGEKLVPSLLLQAEICLFMGKKQQCLELLNQVLRSGMFNTDTAPMSRKVCIIDGTAKRLLSMLLCFRIPDQNRTDLTTQYPLTLASDAVRCHVSVIRTLNNTDNMDKSTDLRPHNYNSVDKWKFLHELLQSLHHICQLYRLTGLSRDARSFLHEGLKISQTHGLPRWSCEFLFEKLRIQSMEADTQGAIATIDIINTILTGSSNKVDDLAVNIAKVDICSSNSQTKTNSDVFMEKECFGFDDSPSQTNVVCIAGEETPELLDKSLESVSIEISSERERRLSKVVECLCMSESRKCDDIVRHRLCLEAGIITSDFLSQSEQRTVADDLLSDAEAKFIPSVMTKTNPAVSFSEFFVAHEYGGNCLPNSGNGEILHYDPRVKYVCLEASCLLAEKYLQRKNYEKVHHIWMKMLELEKSSHMSNILHGNILMARIGLCEASAFFSSQTLSGKSTTVIDNLVESNNMVSGVESVDAVANSFDHLTLGKKKGVTFGKKDEVLIVQGHKMKSSRRKDNKENQSEGENSGKNNSNPIFKTPKKQGRRKDSMTTPLVPLSARKINQRTIQTPLTSRMAALDFLIAGSEDEEDEIMFPMVKPVTPRITKPRKNTRVKCQTEPRKSRSEDKVSGTGPVCDLTKVSFTSSDIHCEGQEIVKKTIDKHTKVKRGRKLATSGLEDTKEEKDICVNEDPKSVELVTDGKTNEASENLTDGTTNEASDNTRATNPKNKMEIDLLFVSSEPSSDPVDKVNSDNRITPGKEMEIVNSGNKASTRREIKPDLNCEKLNGVSRIRKKHLLNVLEGKTSSAVNKDGATDSVDIYDFDTEASPIVGKAGRGRGRTAKKPVAKGRGKATTSAFAKDKTQASVAKLEKDIKVGIINNRDNSEEMVASTKGTRKGRKKKTDNEDVEKEVKKGVSLNHQPKAIPRSTRYGRGKKTVLDDIETARSVEKEMITDANISLDLIEFSDEMGDCHINLVPPDSEFDCLDGISQVTDNTGARCDIYRHVPIDNSIKPALLTFSKPVVITESVVKIPPISKNLVWNYCEPIREKITNSNEDILEEIEIMRGDTKPKKNGTKPTGKRTATKSECVTRKVTKSSESDADLSLVEVVRSSRNLSLRDSCLLEDVGASPELGMPGMNSHPTASSSPDQATVATALESVYRSIRQLAPCPHHADVCKMLALLYIDSNPRRAAFLLTDSLAVTFRHQALLNMDRRVRKNKEEHKSQESQTGPQVSPSVDSHMGGRHLFDSDEGSLQAMVDCIPQDWVVLQVSAINQGTPNQQLLLTRFVKCQSPLIIRLPAFSTPQGRHILKEFASILLKNDEGMKIMKKSDWWGNRMELDSDMGTLVENMETFWLGQWKGAFRPREVSGVTITSARKDIRKAVKAEIDDSVVEVLLLSVPVLSDSMLQKCASELLGSQCSSSDVEKVISIIKKHASTDSEPNSLCHVILILDKVIQHLPWESIPVLHSTSVTRMPCMSHLYTQLTHLQTQESSVFTRGADPESVYYIVNPDDNLTNTQNVFKDWFESVPGWQGIVGVPPTPEQFAQGITDYDLLIYCGHGTGGKYLCGDDIAKLKGRATAILMGCSSGKLKVKGQLEASGMMISYLLAGCPCMIANLWDVTDRDTDRFLEHLLKTWLADESRTPLSKAVQDSRKICKTRINGYAPAVYGLPVYLNKK